MKKAFILSFSTLLIFSIVVLFAIFYSYNVAKAESFKILAFGIEKSGFVADDIVSDVNNLLGTGVDVNRDLNFMVVSFTDNLPPLVSKTALSSYKDFVDNNYSKIQNAGIDLNFESLLDGNTEILFSNGLRYDYNYGATNSIIFYAPYADTNALRFDVNIAVNAASIGSVPWSWNSSGDINVNLIFTDLNSGNSVSYIGKLDSAIENIYAWNYSSTEGDSLFLKVGKIGGNEKALVITEAISDPDSRAGIRIDFFSRAPDSGIEWHYNADLNYSFNDVNINRKIGLGRA